MQPSMHKDHGRLPPPDNGALVDAYPGLAAVQRDGFHRVLRLPLLLRRAGNAGIHPRHQARHLRMSLCSLTRTDTGSSKLHSPKTLQEVAAWSIDRRPAACNAAHAMNV